MEYLLNLDYVAILEFVLRWLVVFWVVLAISVYVTTRKRWFEARTKNELAQAQMHRAKAITILVDAGVYIDAKEAREKVFGES